MKIGPVTEIEVFESAGAVVTEVQVPERLSTFVQSWVRNQANLVFFETDTVELEGRHIPRAQLFQLQINSQRIVFGQEV